MSRRTLLIVYSVLMIPVCVFGLIAGVIGVKDFNDDMAAQQGTVIVADAMVDIAETDAENEARQTARLAQCALLILASAISAAAAMTGIDAAFDPTGGRVAAVEALGLMAFAGAAGGGVCGVIKAGRVFDLQMIGLIAVAAMAALLGYGFFLCGNSNKRFIAIRAALIAAEESPAAVAASIL